VKESAFSDFGMSVKTNLEVKFGADVEWMFVIGVNAGSSAAKANLSVGDRIMAIDGRLVTELDRDAMLAALFQRKKGDRVQFLLLGLKQPLPRFVTLVANRPGS
jgi:C-terminal processing protease CtpA/Prc